MTVGNLHTISSDLTTGTGRKTDAPMFNSTGAASVALNCSQPGSLVTGSGNDTISLGTGEVGVVRPGRNADTIILPALARIPSVFLDTMYGTASTITDFSRAWSDKIVIGAWGLTFPGSGAFTSESGELRYAVTGSTASVMADWDGDGLADLTINFTGAMDFIESVLLL